MRAGEKGKTSRTSQKLQGKSSSPQGSLSCLTRTEGTKESLATFYYSQPLLCWDGQTTLLKKLAANVSAFNAGDPCSISGLGRSPGEGNGNPLLAWSILAWRIPWTEKPGGLQSNGSQRVGHNWVTNTYNRDFRAPRFPGSWSEAGLHVYVRMFSILEKKRVQKIY